MKRASFQLTLVAAVAFSSGPAGADIRWAGDPVIHLDADDLELGPATAWPNKAPLGGEFAVVTEQPEGLGTPLPVPEVKQSIPGPAGVFRKYVEFRRGGGGGYGDDASAMLWDQGAPPEITDFDSFSVEAWVYLTTEVELQTYFSIGRRQYDLPPETPNNFACAAGWVSTGGNSFRAVGMTTANLTWNNPTFFLPDYNHLAATYDAEARTVSVYLNGEFNNSLVLPEPGLEILPGQPVYIGAMWFNANSKYLQQGLKDGGIARLRVHDGVLSEDDVRNNYDSEKFDFQVSILAFGLPGEPAAIAGTDISWSVPYGADVKALAPVYTVSPLVISGDPPSGSPQDFTNPVTYTIVAENGITKAYTVTVSVRGQYDGLLARTYDNEFGTSYLNPISNLLALPPSGEVLHAGDITYPANFAFSAAFPGLTSDDTFAILWEGWFDVSRDGPGDYTFGTESDDGSVVYLDLNEDGDFDDAGELVVDNNRDQPPAVATGTVTLEMDLVRIAIAFYENGGGQAMTARFKFGGGLDWSSLDPVNGRTKHFIAKLEDEPKSSEKDILTFGLPGLPAVIGETAIDWTVPWDADVTKLAPTYTVSPLAIGNPPSGTTRDFSSPQAYVVTAEDGSTKTYTVTVTKTPEGYGLRVRTYDNTQGASYLNPISNLMAIPPSGKTVQLGEISYPAAFGFAAAFPGLTSDDTLAILWKGWFDASIYGWGQYTFGTESDDGSVVYLDLNDDGDFDDPGELVVDNNRDQPPAVATGTATVEMDLVRIAIAFYENGGGQAMTARFGAGPGMPFDLLEPIDGTSGLFLGGNSADMLSFGLPGLPAVIAGTEVSWTVPAGTNVKALAPEYTMSPLATGSPPSGTARDFSSPQAYVVTADDGTSKTYTVTVTVSSAGPIFHRSDANGDGGTNITDGIFVLNYLFLGGPAPPCEDAADANDDEEINITDGIYVLNFLFLGGPAPPSPGPPELPCGPDPDGTALGCATYEGC